MAVFAGTPVGETHAGPLGEANTINGAGGDDDLTGGYLRDDIEGGDGADRINGGAGDDVLSGDAGLDTIYGGTGDDVIRDSSGLGAFDGQTGDDVLEIESVGTAQSELDVYGGRGDDLLRTDVRDIGYARIAGDEGDDVIEVTARESTASFSMVVVVFGGEGDDRISIDADLSRVSSVERGVSVLGEEGDDTIDGSRSDDGLFGGRGDDVIRSGGGSDFIDGGEGDDLIDFGERLLIGRTGAAVSQATAPSEAYGEAGEDTFRPGQGVEYLDGGLGEDRLDFSFARALGVTVNLRSGAGSGGDAAGDRYRSIEAVTGTRFNDVLIGDGVTNTLDGDDGNDMLKGEIGTDFLIGGRGIDTADYREKTAGIVVTLAGSANATVFVGGVAEDTIREVEIIYGGLGADRVTGDAGQNLFRGGAGADAFNGGAGLDTIDFRDKSTSVVLVLNGANVATATIGGKAEDQVRNVEIVYGGSVNDVLVGDAAANQLYGGTGADTLRGGLGADLLSGGAGADTFVFNSVAESSVAATGRDVITDFDATDLIRLTLIDANTALAGDQAFTFGALAAGQAGRLQVLANGAGGWLVRGDVNGDGVADFAVTVNGVQPTAADFQL